MIVHGPPVRSAVRSMRTGVLVESAVQRSSVVLAVRVILVMAKGSTRMELMRTRFPTMRLGPKSGSSAKTGPSPVLAS